MPVCYLHYSKYWGLLLPRPSVSRLLAVCRCPVPEWWELQQYLIDVLDHFHDKGRGKFWTLDGPAAARITMTYGVNRVFTEA